MEKVGWGIEEGYLGEQIVEEDMFSLPTCPVFLC